MRPRMCVCVHARAHAHAHAREPSQSVPHVRLRVVRCVILCVCVYVLVGWWLVVGGWLVGLLVVSVWLLWYVVWLLSGFEVWGVGLGACLEV